MNESIKLGQLITGPGQQRDAIHVAVMPVVAHEELTPGQRVKFVYGSKELVMSASYREAGKADGDDFWNHLEGFTGMRYDQRHRNMVGWTCSC